MKLKINHTTGYKFPEKVFLEPHYLNFKPLPRPYYELEEFDLKIHPDPTGFSERVNLENNQEFQVWMNDMTDRLMIRAEMVLKINEGNYNPMEFILDPFKTIDSEGFVYTDFKKKYLAPYIEIKESPALRSFTRSIFKKKDSDVVAGLFEILDQIYIGWQHERLEEESELDPELCFNNRTGSCRDLAWMLITMLRMEGMASRFVSGYTYNDEMEAGHELHAWVELYLPGAGWVGLDPSLGLFTNEYYIPVATSFQPSNTMPVIGAYRGEVMGEMTTSLNIRPLKYEESQ
jgi:hypothetical protein